MTRTRVLAAVLLAAPLIALPADPGARRSAEACGPFLTVPLFTASTTPTDLERYAAGELGVVQPRFIRRYLFIAYRYGSGRPLTAAERRAAAGAGDGEAGGTGEEAVKAWATARQRVDAGRPAAPAAYEQYGSDTIGTAFVQFLNCPDDAFRTAARTLDARVARAGGPTPAVLAWLDAQDLVFANCSRQAGHTPQIPAPLPANAAPADRADRAYQIAAADFYAGRWDEAVGAFRAIAADRSSPWQPWGDYLAARALIRKGTLSEPEGRDALALAAGALDAILADPALSARHDAARGLRRWLELRLHPQERVLALAERLAGGGGDAPAAVETDLDDYRYLLDRLVGDTVRYPFNAVETEAVRARSDLTDWILTFQADGGFEHAHARWRATGSPLWLVAAISKADAETPVRQALLDAAAGLPRSSPLWITAAFHRIRLLLLADRLEPARALVEEARTAMRGRDAGTENLLDAARLLVAASLDEFTAASLRTPVGYDADGERIGWDPQAPDRIFGIDAADILNERVPLAVLQRVADDAGVPAPLRHEVARAVLVRGILLDDRPAARGAARSLASVHPDEAADFDAIAAAPDADFRQTVLLALARRPGLRPFVAADARRGGRTDLTLRGIDNLRDNWWCALARSPITGGAVTVFAPYETPLYQRQYHRLEEALRPLYRSEEVPVPRFLDAAGRAAADREWAVLDAIGAGPDFLGREVLDWAGRQPEDPRLAEALHLVVRATRYGCTTDGTGAVSRRAFELLHGRYPGSDWARRTPYWFR